MLSFLLAFVVTYLGVCILALLLYTQINPPVTGVQIQRQLEAWVSGRDYQHRYQPVSGERLSPHLKHALVAAEDTRFYEHFGIDIEAIRDAYQESQQRGEGLRGASTITQQLIKNLFMTTHRLWLRKVFEVPLVFAAEVILGKERILELYLNVIEWGDGVYGAEAASRQYYGIAAADLGRWQSASLASVVPAPRDRSPGSAGWYTNIILQRMNTMGW